MKLKLIIYFYFSTLLLIVGCTLPRTTSKTVICPEPEQNCNPGRWSGIPFDTSVIGSQIKGWYYKIEPVYQLNSPENEWSISFIDNKRAAFMYDENDQQKMIIVRMVRPNKFSHESGLHIPFEGHTGPISVQGKNVAFSAVPDRPIEDRMKKFEEIDYPDDSLYKDDTNFNRTYSVDDKNIEILNKLPYEGIVGNSRIFSAIIENNRLTNVKLLGKEINRGFYSWESQPALSDDGKVLFFVSDRKEGIGGTDIWFSINIDGNWSEPINAGDSINSRCDELSPFLTKDGKKLLFSSSGHKTVGGYDIFSVSVSDEFWNDAKRGNIEKIMRTKNYFSNLQNLKPPLNTEYDELFPFCPVDCDSIIYYSSNQAEGSGSIVQMKGGFDLYVRYKEQSPYVLAKTQKKQDVIEFELDLKAQEPVLKTPEYKPPEKYTLQGTVINQTTQKPVPDADVIVTEIPNNQIWTQTKTDDRGKYKVELEKDREFEVTAQGQDLFFDSFKMRVDSDEPTKIVTRDIYLPEIFQLRINFPLDDYSNPYRFTIDSIGIETNRTWQEEIDMLAKNIINSKERLDKVILVGHTDYLGSVEYNNRLGKRRVEFVISELVKRGVPQELLEGRSAGELEPLNRIPGEDENLYRKRLRRVTLEKVLKS